MRVDTSNKTVRVGGGNIWGEVEAVTDTKSFDYCKDLPQAVTSSALEWLGQRDRDRPFCLFVHYDGPHMP